MIVLIATEPERCNKDLHCMVNFKAKVFNITAETKD